MGSAGRRASISPAACAPWQTLRPARPSADPRAGRSGGVATRVRRFPCSSEDRMNDDQNTPRRRGGPGKVVQLRPREDVPTPPSAKAKRMSRLRTLFVIDELDIGGTEQQILETVRRIDRDRFDPFVCCFRHGAKAREIEALGV